VQTNPLAAGKMDAIAEKIVCVLSLRKVIEGSDGDFSVIVTQRIGLEI
jgi:hypothetical protein